MQLPALDPIDLRLLAALQENGRASNLQLAQTIKLSPAQTLRRHRRLEEMGVIRRYEARLDAGSWHSRAHAGEPLPTFENIARWCLANGVFLNIEIKPTPGVEAKTGEVVANHAARLWAGQPVPPLLTSFRPESLQAAQAAQPQLPRGLLLDTLWEGCWDIAQRLQCVAIVCNHALWDRETVARVHAAGMRCLSYTVNDEWAARRLWDLGTDAIITDRVDLFPPV